MELDGVWRACGADEGLRRSYPRVDFDDSSWPEITVPSHWRSSAPFGAHDGPLLYRRQFEHAAPGDGRRVWLTFDGVFYQSDVWLDGSYLGDTEGYFFPHAFEVTDALRERSEHVLAVEVTCSRPGDLTAKRNLTGVFQHWDAVGSDRNPGGIWRPVRLTETGPVRIERLRCVCPEATSEQAVLSFRAVLDAPAAGDVVLRTAVTGVDHESEHRLATGVNRVEWSVTIDQPQLWWPRTLGPQHLHDVEVTVLVPPADSDGAPPTEVSDQRRFRTGLRQVRFDRWVMRVNGERLFLKGTNHGPSRMGLGEAPAELLERDVALAIDANLDLLRVHAHVSREELYAAADEAGLLVWQDMPLQWGYARGIRNQATRQARELVDLLGHHPSIAIWCGHNEPMAIEGTGGETRRPRQILRYFRNQQLPTWNKSILDGSIKRALAKADPTRPVIAHSGVLPHPGSGGTDSHFYFGWYHGTLDDLGRTAAAMPRLMRFLSEFGAQAVPVSDGFMEPERWPDLDWARLEQRHAMQREVFEERVPPGAFERYDDWRAATQAYQAEVIRHHVETLRRLKYRPTGGFAQFSLADPEPAVTWAVVGHDRVAKPGYHALTEACAPVIVVADRPPATVAPGTALALDVHVVSDLREALEGVEVAATLSWPGGSHDWRWQGDISADDCVRVGTVQAVVPEALGPLALDLHLTHERATAKNRYESRITS
jgi:beta-mannosidase